MTLTNKYLPSFEAVHQQQQQRMFHRQTSTLFSSIFSVDCQRSTSHLCRARSRPLRIAPSLTVVVAAHANQSSQAPPFIWTSANISLVSEQCHFLDDLRLASLSFGSKNRHTTVQAVVLEDMTKKRATSLACRHRLQDLQSRPTLTPWDHRSRVHLPMMQ